MSEIARQRSVVQGVSLGLTMVLVAIGVVLQFAALTPVVRGGARSGLTIVRGDAAEPSLRGSSPSPAARSRSTSPYRSLSAGLNASGARAPQPGWTARQVTTVPAAARGERGAAPVPDGPLSAAREERRADEASMETSQRQPGAPPVEVEGVAPARRAPAPAPAVSFGSAVVRPRAESAPAPVPEKTFEPDLPSLPPVNRGRHAVVDVPEETPEPSAGGTQLSLLGPASGRVDDLITYAVVVENARAVAHAPLRLSFDPGVLAFIEAGEGDFLSSDGSGIQFLASEADTPGLVDIALSRTGSGAVTGSGTLCTVTFRAVGNGMSSVAMSGSRLLDASSRPIGFRRNDSHVAVD